MPEIDTLAEYDLDTPQACESRFKMDGSAGAADEPHGATPVTHLAVCLCGCDRYYCADHVFALTNLKNTWSGLILCHECGTYFPVDEMRFVAL